MSYNPVWKGPIEGYAVNYINANMWKLQATMELPDAVQEAWLVFEKCATRYPDVDTPQHFMALFKTALRNRVLDMAADDSRDRARFTPIAARRTDDGDEVTVQEPVGDTENAGVLLTLLRQAPRKE